MGRTFLLLWSLLLVFVYLCYSCIRCSLFVFIKGQLFVFTKTASFERLPFNRLFITKDCRPNQKNGI